MKTWLLLDSDFLCHRAFYSMGNLSHNEVRTGVLFGFLREVVHLQDLFLTDRVVFCFDCGRSLRSIHLPTYKGNREQTEARIELRKQIQILRRQYLFEIGFQNVIYEKGYEADDIIASLCMTIPDQDQIIIVSADKDLFQLLSQRVSLYNPSKKATVTAASFSIEYGVDPIQWVDVKAIAGCNTDNIRGIEGVGEITAAKFINGRLKADSKAFQKIVAGNKTWRSNRILVKLPYPGLEKLKLSKEPDCVTKAGWLEFVEKFGMRSLRSHPPISARSGRKGAP